MDKVNIREKYEKDLNVLWKKWIKSPFHDQDAEAIVKRGYAISKNVQKNTPLLFIGINPAFRKHDTLKLDDNKPGNKFFCLDDYKEDRYFKILFDIAEKTGLQPSYLDLLCIRATKQEIAEKFLMDKDAEPFIQAQFGIFQNIIEEAKPRIISVNNALARALLLNKYKKKTVKQAAIFDFEELTVPESIKAPYIRACTIRNPPTLAGAPVFFTGMLSGRWSKTKNAVDVEKLIAYIKFVKEKQD